MQAALPEFHTVIPMPNSVSATGRISSSVQSTAASTSGNRRRSASTVPSRRSASVWADSAILASSPLGGGAIRRFILCHTRSPIASTTTVVGEYSSIPFRQPQSIPTPIPSAAMKTGFVAGNIVATSQKKFVPALILALPPCLWGRRQRNFEPSIGRTFAGDEQEPE